MGNRLVIDIKDQDDISYLTLSGVIDEDNDLSEISPKVTSSVVAINTSNVERINSCGVRDWVTWLGEIAKKGTKLFLVECPPVIMSQVNLVNNFVGTGTIINFYSPYYCSRCDTDSMLLIDVDDALKSLPFKAPSCRCNQCDLPMEFDDIESSYFSFLNTAKKRDVDPALVEKIKSFSSTEEKIRTRAQSMPLLTITPSSPSPVTYTPTIPADKSFKSLLTDANLSQGVGTPSLPPHASTSKILYLIIGLLAVAIGLLAYVVIKSN